MVRVLRFRFLARPASMVRTASSRSIVNLPDVPAHTEWRDMTRA